MVQQADRDVELLRHRAEVAEQAAVRGRRDAQVAHDVVDRGGVRVHLAGLVRVLLEPAHAGHPVDRVVVTVQLELLVPGLVALGVLRIDVEVVAVGAVFLGPVVGVVLAPGRGGGQRAPVHRVVDDQVDAVEYARFAAVVGVVVGQQLARIQVIVRTRRRGGPSRRGRQRHDAGAHAPQLVKILVVPAQQRGGAVTDPHLPCRARSPGVLRHQVAAGSTVLDPAVALVVQRIDAQRRGLAGGDVDHPVHVLLAVVADAHGGARLELRLRATGDHRDRTGGSVAAEQGALRTLQHFDALDIDERQQDATATPAVHTVDEHAHGRISTDAEVVGLDAAQLDAGLGRLHCADLQTGHECIDVAQVLGGDVTQQGFVHHLQRDRHVLQFLFAALRGHRDLVEGDGIGLLRGILRERNAGGG